MTVLKCTAIIFFTPHEGRCWNEFNALGYNGIQWLGKVKIKGTLLGFCNARFNSITLHDHKIFSWRWENNKCILNQKLNFFHCFTEYIHLVTYTEDGNRFELLRSLATTSYPLMFSTENLLQRKETYLRSRFGTNCFNVLSGSTWCILNIRFSFFSIELKRWKYVISCRCLVYIV